MARVPAWRRYLRFFGSDVAADVRDELSFHLEAKKQELIEQGMSPRNADAEARRSFGDLQAVNALCREIASQKEKQVHRQLSWSSFVFDFRYALRALRGNPAFTVVVVATLAAGMAGSACLFSFVHAWILEPLPFPGQNELAFIRSLNIRRGSEIGISLGDLADLRERATSFNGIAAFGSRSFRLPGESGAERLPGAVVSANFFDVLGVRFAAGRGFADGEDRQGRHTVAVISHGMRKTRWNADADAIGQHLRIEGEPFTIVGVLPETFHFTLVGRASIWTPIASSPSEAAQRETRAHDAIGRLKPGVRHTAAAAELKDIAGALAVEYPASNANVGSFVIPLTQEIGRHTGESMIWVLFGVTIGLLLIACSNVANLLLIRALGRGRQAAIQTSLGADRMRLVRQALVETLLLFGAASMVGALLGWQLASWITGLIPWENRGFLPGYGVVSLSWPVFAFSALVSLVAGLAFGVLPAMEQARTDVNLLLKDSGGGTTGTRRTRVRAAFVVGQIVLAVTLVSVTGLLVAVYGPMVNGPNGFSPDGVLAFRLGLDARQYASTPDRAAFYKRVGEALASLPQEAPPAIARFVPFAQSGGRHPFRIEGSPEQDPRSLPTARFNAVNATFFDVLRIPLREGRVFTAADEAPNAPLAILINDVFALQHFPGRSPIGRSVILPNLNNRTATVAGVVGAIRYTIEDISEEPQFYLPFAQVPGGGDAFLVLRTLGDPLALIPSIRARVAEIDPEQPIYRAQRLRDYMEERFAPYTNLLILVLGFGALALALGAVGVYSVVSFSISQRYREIGIRAALGADRASLLRLFVNRSLVLLAMGAAAGVATATAAAIALRGTIPELRSVSSPPLLAATVALVAVVVLVATIVPARRAAGVDPCRALRSE